MSGVDYPFRYRPGESVRGTSRSPSQLVTMLADLLGETSRRVSGRTRVRLRSRDEKGTGAFETRIISNHPIIRAVRLSRIRMGRQSDTHLLPSQELKTRSPDVKYVQDNIVSPIGCCVHMSGWEPRSRRNVLERTGVIAGSLVMGGCLGSAPAGDNTGSSPVGANRKDLDQDGPDGGTSDDEDDDERTEYDGAITFIYDDGPVEDIELAFPAHERYDAPASVGIVSSWMHGDDPDYMDIDEVRTLEEAGWEISCHTADHAAISSFELVEDVRPGQTRIYPEGRGQHGFTTDNPIEVTDGESLIRRTVVGSGTDETGRYLELDEAVDEAFAAGETIERYTESYVRGQLADSRADLSEFEPTTFLAPHDVIDEYHADIVSDYYGGIFNANIGDPANEVPFDPFETNRSYFAERVDRDTIYADLEAVAEADAYGVIGAHTYLEEVTRDRIEETLKWCDDLGLEVITFDEAIERFATPGAASDRV